MPITTKLSRGSVVLLPFPFSDQSGVKLRPAIIVSPVYPSEDFIVVGVSSVGSLLRPGEFPIHFWREARLLHPSFVKRAVTTISRDLIRGPLGFLQSEDLTQLNDSLRQWLELS
jgi:mRNA interferase MazF